MAPLTLARLAELAGAALPAPPPAGAPRIDRAASLAAADAAAVAFYSHPRHRAALRRTRAGAVLLRAAAAAECPAVPLVCDDPYLAMARVLQALHPPVPVAHFVHPDAAVDPAAVLAEPVRVETGCVIGAGSAVGAGSALGAHCVLGEGVTLGADCRLHARVTLLPGTRLGDRVEIWPGAVLGADGFGYAEQDRAWLKLRHRGGLVVGDDCEIGANTTIDRGMLDDTVIGRGVKIDNQVQIAHNVRIGDHTAIAGCAGIAGSARIGRHCRIGGAAGVQGHVELADGVIITGMSKASQSLRRPGVYSSGTAVQDNARWLRNAARFKRLDDIVRALRRGDRP